MYVQEFPTYRDICDHLLTVLHKHFIPILHDDLWTQWLFLSRVRKIWRRSNRWLIKVYSDHGQLIFENKAIACASIGSFLTHHINCFVPENEEHSQFTESLADWIVRGCRTEAWLQNGSLRKDDKEDVLHQHSLFLIVYLSDGNGFRKQQRALWRFGYLFPIARVSYLCDIDDSLS